VDAIFTVPSAPGTALISIAVGPLSMTTTLEIATPLPNQIDLISGKSEVSVGSTAPLTVTVSDKWGNPVAGQTVRLDVSGDGDTGTIDSSTIVTLTTNSSGQILASFAPGTKLGNTSVAATLLANENGNMQPSLFDTVAILVTQKMFLPQISK
jgi:hypothetical protein